MTRFVIVCQIYLPLYTSPLFLPYDAPIVYASLKGGRFRVYPRCRLRHGPKLFSFFYQRAKHRVNRDVKYFRITSPIGNKREGRIPLERSRWNTIDGKNVASISEIVNRLGLKDLRTLLSVLYHFFHLHHNDRLARAKAESSIKHEFPVLRGSRFLSRRW